jgi:hypothetical protein
MTVEIISLIISLISSPNTLFTKQTAPLQSVLFIKRQAEIKMKTFTRDYNIRPFGGGVFDLYFGGLRPCVFDIETTGLSSARGGKIILTAMMIPHGAGMRTTQFLAEDPYEEDRVIMATAQLLEEENIGCLITYNGDSFDVPFVKRRIDALGLPCDFMYFDFDVYSFLRKCSVLPEMLDSMSQKNVERYFGIGSDRYDVITGRESVKLYSDYVRTGDTVTEKVILTHNREDVLQLEKLLHAAGTDDFLPILRLASFDEAAGRTGFPSASGSLSARPRLAADCLTVTGRQFRPPGFLSAALFPDFDSDISAEFNSRSAAYEIRIPLLRRGRSSFCDLIKLSRELGIEKTSGTGSGSTEGAAEAADNAQAAHGHCADLMEIIRDLPGCVNDYLILSDDGAVQHREMNMLAKLVSTRVFDRLIASMKR